MVCTANQCRSPMAQLLLARDLAAAGIGADRVQVSSAGVRASAGIPVTPQSADQLLQRGIDPAPFMSTPLTDEMVRNADIVLTATRNHRSQVLERVPLALRRTFTLLEFAAIVGDLPPARAQEAPGLAGWVRRAAAARGVTPVAEYDIDDPAGGPDEGYARAAVVIAQACRGIAAALIAAI
jgi:protein-tyrosine phosphatase